jgi:hypothetical protein
MIKLTISMLAVALSLSSPAMAGTDGFTLVNQSGSGIGALAIRRTGTQAWQPVGSPLSLGARSKVAFTDQDCAFDIKATLTGGKEAVWRGVNLCEVSNVTLRRDSSGATWAEYD